MTKRIIYTENDIMKVIIPAGKDLSTKDLNGIATAVVPDGISFKIINQSDLPSDRTFRDAWKEDGGSIGVDITKAREVQKDKIRIARAPLMTALDHKQNDGEDVSAERQRLKDFPDLVNTVTDLEELKALIPMAEG